MAKQKAIEAIRPEVRNGAEKVLILFKGRQGKGQSVSYAYFLPIGRILLGNPMIPGDPTLRGIRPGPNTVRPDIEIYRLADEWDAVCLLRHKVARRIK